MVVTDSGMAAGRDLVDVCVAAVRGGATSIEVRDKGGDPRGLFELTSRLISETSVPVLVNDRLDVALAAGAAGCHLGSDDLPAIDARRIAPEGFLIGVSVGLDDEVGPAQAAQADYWGVGPCFGTATKPDAGHPIGVEGFAHIRRRAGAVPCVGIGGITSETASSLVRAGAVGVAVVRAVMAASDPEAAARTLHAAIAEALNAGT